MPPFSRSETPLWIGDDRGTNSEDGEELAERPSDVHDLVRLIGDDSDDNEEPDEADDEADDDDDDGDGVDRVRPGAGEPIMAVARPSCG